MFNRLKDPYEGRRRISRSGVLVVAFAALFLVFQSACIFSKKSTTEAAVTSPVRVVLLPFNVGENKDLYWASLAAPILMAKAGEP